MLVLWSCLREWGIEGVHLHRTQRSASLRFFSEVQWHSQERYYFFSIQIVDCIHIITCRVGALSDEYADITDNRYELFLVYQIGILHWFTWLVFQLYRTITILLLGICHMTRSCNLWCYTITLITLNSMRVVCLWLFLVIYEIEITQSTVDHEVKLLPTVMNRWMLFAVYRNIKSLCDRTYEVCT